MINTNIVQDISGVLDATLQKSLMTGEQVIVRVPGAMGEAFAATNRRVFVVREKPVLDGVDLFVQPISAVKDVTIEQMATGGALKITTGNWMPEDQRTVYFPSEMSGTFAAAASTIKGMIASGAGTQTAAEKSSLAPIKGNSCPSCGAAVDEKASFCNSCGEQVRDVCRMCGSGISPDAKFCYYCGTEHKAANTKCRNCGGRINETVMSYCPQCGTAVSDKCVSCGAAIIEGWPRCRYCGREIGSMEGVTARGIRTAVAQAQAATATLSTSEVRTDESSKSPGAKQNARGAELFDKESFEEAIEAFRQAVILEPNNASFHCNLAVAYDELDQDEDARREYERTLELNPNDTTAMLYLGYMLNENDEHERAAKLWRRLISAAPGSPEAEEAAQNIRAQEEL